MTPRPVHLLALLTLLAGCTRPNRASIEMATICSPPTDAKSCGYGAKCDKSTLQNQTVDVDMTDTLFLGVETHNQLVMPEDVPGLVNTHDAFVQEIDVSYSVAGLTVGSITNNIQQTVPAGGTAVLGLYLLNGSSASEFRAGLAADTFVEVIATVTLKGILGDGSEFETGPYRVPFDVCRGCLGGAYVCPDVKQMVTAVCPAFGQWPATIACGEAPTFTIGGAVANLTDTDLVLRCNGTDIAVSGTSWTSEGIVDGSPYACTINQPSTQTCNWVNPALATGTISGANITNLDITCAP